MSLKSTILRNPLPVSLLLVVALACASLVTVKAQNPRFTEVVNSSSDSLSSKERVEVFEEVWKAINEKYYDPKFNGVDWGAVHERYRPLVDTVKSEAEFYDLLNQMAGELREAHTRVFAPRVHDRSAKVFKQRAPAFGFMKSKAHRLFSASHRIRMRHAPGLSREWSFKRSTGSRLMKPLLKRDGKSVCHRANVQRASFHTLDLLQASRTHRLNLDLYVQTELLSK